MSQRGNEVGDHHYNSFREQMMDMAPLDPRRRLSVELEAAEWGLVLRVLHEHPLPFRVVRPIVDTLYRQLNAEAAAPAPAFERMNVNEG